MTIKNKLQIQKDRIIKWNYQFPLDKWYREKYKIPLWSEEHLKLNQLDILNEWLEEQVYVELNDNVIRQINIEKSMKDDGRIVESHINEDKLFDEMKY